VTTKATIMASTYMPLQKDSNSFGLGLYNEALKIIHDSPQYYPFEVMPSE
ncbi:replication protein A 14 kDa subunit, partial [Acipenser oxyrinchus oxyrinchus]